MVMLIKIKIAAAVICAAVVVGGEGTVAVKALTAGGAEDKPVRLKNLPPNTWKQICEGGGKWGSCLVSAENVGRIYTWGPGGFELASFSPAEKKWRAALPESKKEAWAGGKWPKFVNFKKDGGRTRPWYLVVGGNSSPNTVRWWDLDGLRIPSPPHVFNQACYDSKRKRILFFAGGHTFALDPKNNSWTDLKAKKSPVACEALAWASMCYDPVNDEFLLFGGGMALNLEGGARTWLYDPKANSWRRPKMKVEPPLRCTAPIVYDRKNKVMVMFGGDNQAAALNDTWVYHCRERRWEERKPNPSPPPMFVPASAAVPGGGRVLVCGTNALTAKRGQSATSANKETWIYDVSANTWRSTGNDLSLRQYSWLTAVGSEKHGVVFLLAVGRKRRTYAFRYDPSGPARKRKGAPPNTTVYKHAGQKKGIESAPKPNRAAHERFLKALPSNQWVDPKPPASVANKTWGSATFDTDRGEVIYTGGGHCGYSGNDVAHYNVADNRWSLSWAPSFPPFLEGTNSTVFGWSYGCRPWSQHTYRWYAYDPQSKTMVFCPRQSPRGREVLLEKDPARAVRHGKELKGSWTFVYDTAKREFYPPSFGRSFWCHWGAALCGTPQGIYATDGKDKLYHGTVKGGRITWKVAKNKVPRLKGGWHFEYMPLLYDSKRDRLLLFMGHKKAVEVYERPLKAGGTWKKLATRGTVQIGREVVYNSRHDTVLLLAPGGRLYAMDCTRNEWRELDTPPKSHGSTVDAFMVYDPIHDVCVQVRRGPNKLYLLRFDPRTARYKQPTPAGGKRLRPPKSGWLLKQPTPAAGKK
jgi:hypothetical protein